ncbi:MAG: hypothetical protein IJ037_13325 [Clostridia bacterium]|nr:hypothetical protein [Clostridia bacterium]
MKHGRIALTVLTVFLAVVFIGCSADETGNLTMSDICVFRQRSNGIPVRTVLSSGITSTVCVDPLCIHTDDCPLYGINNLSGEGAVALGDYYCFTSGDIALDENTGLLSGEIKLCVYNMTDGKIRVLEVYADNVLLLYGYENYLYYTTAAYSKTDAGVQYRYSLCRADIKSGKIIDIPMEGAYISTGNAMNTSDFPDIYTIDNDRIYWYAPGENVYIHYTTDLEGKSRRELPLASPRIMNGVFYDGWAYYTVNRNDGSIADCRTNAERQKFLNEQTLRRYHMETGKDELVVENIAKYIVTDEGIFYTVYENEGRKIDFNGETHTDIFAGKLYRMNHDGSNAALFCTLDNINLSVWSELFLGYASGKLALAYMDQVENDWFESGYDYNIAPEIIIVNTADGAWRISTDET